MQVQPKKDFATRDQYLDSEVPGVIATKDPNQKASFEYRLGNYDEKLSAVFGGTPYYLLEQLEGDPRRSAGARAGEGQIVKTIVAGSQSRIRIGPKG